MKNLTIAKNTIYIIVYFSLLIFSSAALSENNKNERNIEATKQEQVKKFIRFQSLNSDGEKLPDYEYIERKHNTDRTKFSEENN